MMQLEARSTFDRTITSSFHMCLHLKRSVEALVLQGCFYYWQLTKTCHGRAVPKASQKKLTAEEVWDGATAHRALSDALHRMLLVRQQLLATQARRILASGSQSRMLHCCLRRG